MPSTNPTATASAISRPRPVKVHFLLGSFGMRLDPTHAELVSFRLAQSSCGGSQFTVKSSACVAGINEATTSEPLSRLLPISLRSCGLPAELKLRATTLRASTGGREFRCVDCDLPDPFELPEVTKLLPRIKASERNCLRWLGDGRPDTPKVSGVASELSRYLGPTSAAWFRSLAWRSVMSGNIFNSNGAHVGVVDGAAIFDLKGQKLYHLKGVNIYRLSGELVGHLNGTHGSDKRLDRFTDRLFPSRGGS